jgi:broad specificity polyphosphatase/5'/3'-nucleotidase SurE
VVAVVVGGGVGFGLGEGVVLFEGAVVTGALGGTVAAGVLEARCEGAPEVAGSLTARDFTASVAFFWLAMTGSAAVTTASAAAINAANQSFLKGAPSG